MAVTLRQMKEMLIGGAERVVAAKDELTDIDSRFGDADHGVTMEKIMTNLENVVRRSAEDVPVRALMNDISMGIMTINGGSAVPLWVTFFEGLGEGAPERAYMNEQEFKQMFRSGYETLTALSKARRGDKTMMDALVPAVDALCASEGTLQDIMKAAAEAAEAGARDTANFAAKFGRARSYGEGTIGTPDAGALSMRYFFTGLAEGAQKKHTT